MVQNESYQYRLCTWQCASLFALTSSGLHLFIVGHRSNSGWMFWILSAVLNCRACCLQTLELYNRRDCFMLCLPTWILMIFIFFCNSYMRYSYFVGVAAEWCLIIIMAYFGTLYLYMIKSPLFGFVNTQGTMRVVARV